jgi:hypothetical protein
VKKKAGVRSLEPPSYALSKQGRNKVKKAKKRKLPAKKEGILISFAESIGSTLGAIAAKTGAAQETLNKRNARRKPRLRKT